MNQTFCITVLVLMALVFPLLPALVSPSAKILINGCKVVYYGAWVKGFGVILLGLASYVSFWILKVSNNLSVTIASAMLMLLSLAMVLEFYFTRFEFTSDTVFAYSFWRKKRVLRLSGIREIVYAPNFRWFVLKAESKGVLAVSMLMSGVRDFIDEVESGHVHPEL